MPTLQYALPGDAAQVLVTLAPGEALGGFIGPVFFTVGDVLNDRAEPAASVRALIQGGSAVAAAPTPVPVPPPPPNTQLSGLAFMALFTADEQDAILASSVGPVRRFCWQASAASYVDLADPRVVAGVGMLESLGLIAQGRAAQVLAGQAPASPAN